LRRRALATLNQALAEKPADPSGLLAIRGTTLQALWRLRDGLRDYQAVWRMRIEQKEDAGRLGEAESELGWGYFMCSLTRPS